jgi:hypothetical protein
MSDINISGIPNMGFAGGGGGYFGGNAGLGLPAVGAAGDFGASKMSQPLYNNIFGNFGQLTDYYSALGAAYGRQTGYYGDTSGLPPGLAPQPGGGGGGGGDPYAIARANVAAREGGKAFGAGATPFNDYGGGANPGGFSPSPNYPGVGDYNPFISGAPAFNPYGGGANPGGFSPSPNYPGGMGSLFDPGAYGGDPYAAARASVTAREGRGVNPYAGSLLGPQANPSYFNPGTYAGDQGNYGLPPPQSGSLPGDIGFSKQPSYPNLGYNPGMQNYFANPGMQGNQFLSTFSHFPNSATPSQYTYQPYTNTQGQTFQPNLPQGFAPLYDVDHPQGALPLGGTNLFGDNSQAGG